MSKTKAGIKGMVPTDHPGEAEGITATGDAIIIANAIEAVGEGLQAIAVAIMAAFAPKTEEETESEEELHTSFDG